MPEEKVKNKIWNLKLFSSRGGIDVPFFVLAVALLAFGLIMMFSASYAYAYYHEKGDSYFYIKKQLVFAAVGFIAMIAASFMDYHWWRVLALPIMGVSVALLVIVLFLPDQANVRRWINLGFFGFQPSEIAKFAMIILFAHFISLNYKRMDTFAYGVLPYSLVLGLISVLLLLEPHISCTVIVITIGLIMMFVGGTKLRYFGILGGTVVAGLTAVILSGKISYAMSRLDVWINPWSDPQGKGWQNIQALYAIGSGGFLGLGLGNSRQKYLYISEPQTDFVFAVICEELGYIGAVLIIVLFGLLVWRGFVIGLKSKDKLGLLIAIGLTAQVGIQAALNIAVVTKLIPNTGISLPFFSYGGTSLMMLLAQMGVVLSVSRSARLVKV